jgi:hypothetical protein
LFYPWQERYRMLRIIVLFLSIGGFVHAMEQTTATISHSVEKRASKDVNVAAALEAIVLLSCSGTVHRDITIQEITKLERALCAEDSQTIKKKKNDDGSMIYFCDFSDCSYSSSILDDITEHKSSHNQYKCTLCRFTTSTLKFLEFNLRQHNKEKSFKCPECDNAYAALDGLTMHLKKKHRIACKYCDFAATTKKMMQLHVRDIHETYKCQFCDFSSADKYSLMEHTDRHTQRSFESQYFTFQLRTGEYQVTQPPIEKYTYKCWFCSYLTNTQTDLHTHSASCKQKRPLIPKD